MVSMSESDNQIVVMHPFITIMEFHLITRAEIGAFMISK